MNIWTARNENVLGNMFWEAVPANPQSSQRYCPSGYGFSSQGGPWRWAGVATDGEYLHCAFETEEHEYNQNFQYCFQIFGKNTLVVQRIYNSYYVVQVPNEDWDRAIWKDENESQV